MAYAFGGSFVVEFVLRITLVTWWALLLVGTHFVVHAGEVCIFFPCKCLGSFIHHKFDQLSLLDS